MDKNSSNERCNITALSNTLQNIMKYADETARQFFGEDIVDVAACSTEIPLILQVSLKCQLLRQTHPKFRTPNQLRR